MLVAGAAVGCSPGVGDDGPAAAGATDKAPTDSPGTSGPPPPSRAQLDDIFAAMADAVAGEQAADFVDAAGSTAWARRTWRSLAALGVADVSMRVLDSRPAGAPALTHATVEVSWAPGAAGVYDGARTSPRTVTFTVRTDGAGVLQVSRAGAGRNRGTPPWLFGPLAVTELDGGAAVVLPGASAELARRAPALTRAALAAVDESLTAVPASMRREVVVLAPATSRQAAGLLGRGSSVLDGTAAVTATSDGSGRTSAPVHVVLNPAELHRLSARGAQVVLTHEAVHAATGVAALQLPFWVVEGFADWVALRDGDVPVRVAAAELLGSVRADGLPRSLPRRVRQDGEAVLSYEAAWTAFRLLDRRVGETGVVGFYVDVLAGMPVGSALWRSTGLDVPELTGAWRANLRRLARG